MGVFWKEFREISRIISHGPSVLGVQCATGEEHVLRKETMKEAVSGPLHHKMVSQDKNAHRYFC
jgi:hypothetical protein